jgi:hypothetical protein
MGKNKNLTQSKPIISHNIFKEKDFSLVQNIWTLPVAHPSSTQRVPD